MITTNSKRLRYIYIVMSKVKKYCIFLFILSFFTVFFITVAFIHTVTIANNYLLKCDSALDLFQALGFC